MIIEFSISIDGNPVDENDEKEISAKITEIFLVANTEIILNKNLKSILNI